MITLVEEKDRKKMISEVIKRNCEVIPVVIDNRGLEIR